MQYSRLIFSIPIFTIGDAPTQEKAIQYHSLLVERDLLKSDAVENQSSNLLNNLVNKDIIPEGTNIIDYSDGIFFVDNDNTDNPQRVQ